MELTKRKQAILTAILQEYAKTCESVSSQTLKKNHFKDISSATIRSEMAQLEEMGYLHSPHTSAGRFPTEQAYHFYIAHNSLHSSLSKELKNEIKKSVQSIKDSQGIKLLAKVMAKEMDACIMVAFTKNDHYFTGVSALLSKKDFSNPKLLYNISSIIDQMDDILTKIFDEISDDISVLVGQYNPFSRLCSALTIKMRNSHLDAAFIVLTPLRTHYEKNYSLLEYIKNELKNV